MVPVVQAGWWRASLFLIPQTVFYYSFNKQAKKNCFLQEMFEMETHKNTLIASIFYQDSKEQHEGIQQSQFPYLYLLCVLTVPNM